VSVCCTPAVALGAVAPAPEFSPPPLTSPRLSLWCALASPAPIVAPALKPPPCFVGASVGDGAAAGGASTPLLLVGLAGGVGSSLLSSGDSQLGSSMSTRPSLSSSTSLEQAGSVAAGTAGVVVSGVVVSVDVVEGSSAPAKPTPSAVTTPKLARAMISASLFLI
jgi:hypothetical protein